MEESSNQEIKIKYPFHMVTKDLGDLFGADFVSSDQDKCSLL